MSNRGWVFDVLYAYPDETSTPARLVLSGPGWYLLTPNSARPLDWSFRTDPQGLQKKQG